jgi:hypothetical protein
MTCIINTFNGASSLGQLRTLDLGETSVKPGADPDPRVEMPSPNLEGTPPEATDYEFIVSGPDNVYTPAKAKIPIVAAEWIVNKPLKGFDGSSHPPRMVVGINKESDAAKLKLSANIQPANSVSIGGTNMLDHSAEDGNLMAGNVDAATGPLIRPWQADYIKRP